jgi:hypothetical protein
MKKLAKRTVVVLSVIALIPAWEYIKTSLLNGNTNPVSGLSEAKLFSFTSELEKFIQNDVNFILLLTVIMALSLYTLFRTMKRRKTSTKKPLKEKVKMLRAESIFYNKEIATVKNHYKTKHFTTGEQELISKIKLMSSYGK